MLQPSKLISKQTTNNLVLHIPSTREIESTYTNEMNIQR